MKRLIFQVTFFCFISVFFINTSVFSEDFLIGVKPTPPFVSIDKDNNVSGFSIDLIKSVVNQLENPKGIKFHIDNNMASHLDSVMKKKVDFGIAATTITSVRESVLDFSQPFYQADIAILVPYKEESKHRAFIAILKSRELLMTIIGIVAYIIVIAHLIWIVERNAIESHFSKKYFQGIGHGLWWTVVTISTVGYGDYHLKKPLGKMLGVFVIFSGIMIFGVAIASLTTVMTVKQLKPEITGPEDLPGRKVAVLPSTFTADITAKMGTRQRFVNTLEEGLEAVRKGYVDALIHDRPLLKYLIKDLDKQEFMIVDKGFAESTYGITFPQGSPDKELIDVALLKAMEGGSNSVYSIFHRKWFGE